MLSAHAEIETKSVAYNAESTPTSGTWYNIGSQNITIPPGTWRVEFSVHAFVEAGAVANQSVYVTLSTTSNSESDAEFTAAFRNSGTDTACVSEITLTRGKIITLTAEDVFYLNFKTANATQAEISYDGTSIPLIIRAVRIK